MRTSHPHSILHLQSEGAVAINYEQKPDGSREPKLFYQSPKATGSLEMALKRFFEDAPKKEIYINVVSEAATLSTFRDTTLLREKEAFAQVMEASSGIAERECDVCFLESENGSPFKGNSPLLVNSFKRSDFLRAQAIASELGFENFKVFNNALSTVGAINEWRSEYGSGETVAFLEVGINASTVTTCTPNGQVFSKRIPVSVQDIAEGIQKKLQLKFESAALLLYYNGVFDFSQHQQAIAANFGEKLHPHLQNASSKAGKAIDRLLITSLPPSYGWINEEVPESIGLRGFSSDEFYFFKDLKVSGDCANNPGFIGTIFCAHSQPDEHPWMVSLPMQSIEVACKLSQKYAATTPPTISPEDEVNALEAASMAGESIEAAADLDSPFEAESITPPNPNEEGEGIQPNAPADLFDHSPSEEILIEESETSPVEVITFQKAAKESTHTPARKSESPVDEEEEKEHNILGIVFGSLVALFILGGAAFLFFQNAKPAPAPVPISRHQEEKPAGMETLPEVAAIPQALEQPDAITEEISEPETADLSPAAPQPEESLVQAVPVGPELEIPMATMVIHSVPSGASVFVNGKSKGQTPLTVDELQFGQYAVEFKLDGYVTQLLDVSLNSEEVKTVETTLQLPLGTLDIKTTPSGVAFEIVSVAGLDRVVHSGVTPATVGDVLQGDYEVIFTRDNWEDYSERVEVRYNDKTQVDLVYPEGWLMITSSPDNASVFEGGKLLGKTPLRLKGLKEGEKHYTIRHSGYEDYGTSATIVAQNEVKIEAELLSWDREVNYSELDIPPVQVKRGLYYTQRLTGNDSHRFVVEFVINKEGTPEQIEVLETTYFRAHERLLKDISRWVFEPGMRKDRPVKTRVRLPIILGDVSKIPPAVELARAEKEER